jgi:hypothetical protein
MKVIRNISEDITTKKTVTYEPIGEGTENNRQPDTKICLGNNLHT